MHTYLSMEEPEGQTEAISSADKILPVRRNFSGSLTLILSCLGCSIGTGNIWRFPRIIANSTTEHGALVFIILWAFFLFLGSIPILLIEYASGRYTKKGVIHSFFYFLGPKSMWCGMWVCMCNFFISSYYHVISGWCMFYTVRCMIYPLPQTYEESREIFYDFTSSYWPLLTLFLAHIYSFISVFNGVRTIETANLILTPTLLAILVIIFLWSGTRTNAMNGINFLFNPDWNSFSDPRIWLNAASQNAFDTGAGTGQFLTYATFMQRDKNIVKYSIGIPIGNNLVSLMCGMTLYCTAFASLAETNPNITTSEVLEIIKSSGHGGTGISFIWLPVLLNAAGVMGRVVGVFLFLSMVFAGVTSTTAFVEVLVHSFEDYGLPRKIVVPFYTLLQYGVGAAAAMSLDFMDNQDLAWGYALLVCALLMQVMVMVYGGHRFREKIIIPFGNNDIKVPKMWVYIVKFVCPALTAAMLLWWIVSSIMEKGSDWYKFEATSLFPVLVQWVFLMGILIFVNWVIFRFRPRWLNGPDERSLIEHTDIEDHHLEQETSYFKPPPPELLELARRAKEEKERANARISGVDTNWTTEEHMVANGYNIFASKGNDNQEFETDCIKTEAIIGYEMDCVKAEDTNDFEVDSVRTNEINDFEMHCIKPDDSKDVNVDVGEPNGEKVVDIVDGDDNVTCDEEVEESGAVQNDGDVINREYDENMIEYDVADVTEDTKSDETIENKINITNNQDGYNWFQKWFQK